MCKAASDPPSANQPTTDDREVLVCEIQRLLITSRRWRAIAIAAIVLVFVVLIPFTIGFWRLAAIRESRQVRRALQHALDRRDRPLVQKAKADGK